MKSVDGRLKELEKMLTDCRAFDQTRLEFVVWMSEMKVAFNKLPDSYPLDAELQEIQVVACNQNKFTVDLHYNVLRGSVKLSTFWLRYIISNAVQYSCASRRTVHCAML